MFKYGKARCAYSAHDNVSLYEPEYLLNMKIATNFRLLSYFISNIHLRLLGFAAISRYIKTVYTLSETSNALRKMPKQQECCWN